jgi:transketolase
MISLSDAKIAELETISRRVRGRLLRMSHEARAPHLGSALSCVDILIAAYWGALRIRPEVPDDDDRDRFILSKGHASSALYAVLAERGFFPLEWLDGYGRPGGRLPEHMAPGCVPGIEAATGSLGHGLSMGVGMALAGRIKNRSYRVCVVLSDGECNEGSVWEAAMFAAVQKPCRIVAIVDYNRWQATGRSDEVMALQPLAAKWESFGWRTVSVDGHDIRSLVDAMNRAFTTWADGPAAIVASTVKGKGVSFMEDDNNWHYRIPTAEEIQAAQSELGLR